jgi:hypothetical protein
MSCARRLKLSMLQRRKEARAATDEAAVWWCVGVCGIWIPPVLQPARGELSAARSVRYQNTQRQGRGRTSTSAGGRSVWYHKMRDKMTLYPVSGEPGVISARMQARQARMASARDGRRCLAVNSSLTRTHGVCNKPSFMGKITPTLVCQSNLTHHALKHVDCCVGSCPYDDLKLASRRREQVLYRPS